MWINPQRALWHDYSFVVKALQETQATSHKMSLWWESRKGDPGPFEEVSVSGCFGLNRLGWVEQITSPGTRTNCGFLATGSAHVYGPPPHAGWYEQIIFCQVCWRGSQRRARLFTLDRLQTVRFGVNLACSWFTSELVLDTRCPQTSCTHWLFITMPLTWPHDLVSMSTATLDRRHLNLFQSSPRTQC